MTATPPFDPEALDELRDSIGVVAPKTEPAPAPQPDVKVGAKQKLKRRVKGVAAPFLHQVAVRLTEPVSDLVAQRLLNRFEPELDRLQTELEIAKAQLLLVNENSRDNSFSGAARVRETVGELRSLAVNVELMSAEIREARALLDDVGSAIAPGAGIGGVAGRFAELRQQVNVLARQLRAVPTSGPAGDAPSGDRMEAEPVTTSSFDYVGLERRFRGESDDIAAKFTERYLDVLRDHQPVLDIGCGSGELLGALAARGVVGSGVDLDAGMVEEALAKGVDAHHGDAIAYLRAQPEHGFGAMFSIQVIEHLRFDVIQELVTLAISRLEPGGVLVMETPNPLALFVLGNTFLLDPTHVRPIHPSLLVFLCERAGFADIELRFEAPLTSHHLPLLDLGPDAPDWVASLNASLQRLNDVLFGPQDYAVIATTPA